MIEYGYRAFQAYLGVKLHFDSKNTYDIFEYNGNVSAKIESFNKRKDKWQFAKLDKQFPEYKDLLLFLAENFFHDEKTFILPLIKPAAMKRYNEYKHYEDSMSYEFQKELETLINEYGIEHLQSMFDAPQNEYPEIFTKMVSGEVSPWFFIIMDRLSDFVDKANIDDPVIWNPKIYHVKQFEPFMVIDVESIIKVIDRLF